MGIKKKEINLNTVFGIYIIALITSFFILIVILLGIFGAGLQTGLIYPANYTEDLARKAKAIIENNEEMNERIIPTGCKFVLLDKNGKMLFTDMTNSEIKNAIAYSKGETVSSIFSYIVIDRADETYILQYNVRPRYHIAWMNRYLPNPDNLFFSSLIVGCLISSVIVSMVVSKKLKNQLKPLIEATNKIKNRDLEFESKNSKIKEFNEVLMSLDDMKSDLKNSLLNQWNLERTKREQISSLAHDIKTPLTIIKGNTELLNETSLDQEQKLYTEFILKNTNQMEEYIQLLINVSKDKEGFQVQLKEVNTEKFLQEVMNQFEALSLTKQLKIKLYKEKDLPCNLIIDEKLMYRALMNILSNAIDYTPNEGMIHVRILHVEDKLQFIIEDNGDGFSKEALKSAKAQFFMEENSRNSKFHYGMGLYIADSIVKLHHGELILENSKELKGAKVMVELSV